VFIYIIFCMLCLARVEIYSTALHDNKNWGIVFGFHRKFTRKRFAALDVVYTGPVARKNMLPFYIPESHGVFAVEVSTRLR